MKKLFFILLIFLFNSDISAQTGQWYPYLRDDTWPRTIYTDGELPRIKDTILTSLEYNIIYKSIYASASKVDPGTRSDEYKDYPDKKPEQFVAGRSYMAKNAAFVLLMNRKADGITPLTSSEKVILRDLMLLFLSPFNISFYEKINNLNS